METLVSALAAAGFGPLLDAVLNAALWIAGPAAGGGAHWVTAARLLVAAAAIPLLFRALADDSGKPVAPRVDLARRLFFALLGGAVLFALTSRWAPGEPSGPGAPSRGRGFQALVGGVNWYRLSYTPAAAAIPPPKGTPSLREAGIRELQTAADLLPDSAFVQRYAGIVLAAEGRYDRALQRLDRATEILAQRAPERARQERALWHTLYGPRPPDPAAIEAARRQLEAWRIGWIGRVAVLAAYRRQAGGRPDSAPAALERRVRAEAAAAAEQMLLLGLFLVIVLPQLGLVSLGVGVALAATGVLRPATPRRHPVSHILWEGFLLMLALAVAPGWIAFGGRRPVPETQPGLVALLLLVGDALQLVALAYLAWRLRRRGFGLDEIGLTTRHLGANLLVGAMAATVLMPAAMLVGYVTQRLTEQFFPNVAPPYHPLGGLTATAPGPEIRLALFIGAAVAAPLLEEIFFRGALFGALRRRHRLWTSILASAGVFAILHPQLPLGFLPIAFLGASFAWLYDWRQSLVPGIVAHALNNGLIFLLLTRIFPA